MEKVWGKKQSRCIAYVYRMQDVRSQCQGTPRNCSQSGPASSYPLCTIAVGYSYELRLAVTCHLSPGVCLGESHVKPRKSPDLHGFADARRHLVDELRDRDGRFANALLIEQHN